MRKSRPTNEHVDRLAQEVGARPRAGPRKLPTICYPGAGLGQMTKASRLDEHLVVVVDDPATTAYQDGVWMLAQELHLDGQAARKEQVILTHEFDELASRSLYTSSPVAMQVERFGGLWEESYPWISKGSDDLDASVCRGLIGDHGLDALIRLS
jgi:hypothetical protein